MRTARTSLLVAVFLATGALVAPASAADPPPSMWTEQLFDDSTGFLEDQPCHSDGTDSTIEFSLSGEASGPYPGTYTQEGHVTVGPAPNGDLSSRPTLAFESTFRIESGDAVITGTMTLDATYPSTAYCTHVPYYDANPGGMMQHLFSIYTRTRFDAVIHTPHGTFSDSGYGYNHLVFNEIFLTEGGVSSNHGASALFISDGDVQPVGPGPAVAIDLTPSSATAQVGSQHTVTAHATDASGAPATPTTVQFDGGSCTTGDDGTCSFTYDGPPLPGEDTITGCAGDLCDTAGVTWTLPTSTSPGLATAGGQIRQGGGKVTVALEAHAALGRVNGTCLVLDHSTPGDRVVCTSVDAFVRSGTTATVFGTARVGGVPTTYRIDVVDNGEPGRGRDTFRLRTGSGYAVSGVLDNGNIQVRPS